MVLEAMVIEAGREAIRPGEGNQVQMDGREIQAIESNTAP
jgi:hypothetical protein